MPYRAIAWLLTYYNQKTSNLRKAQTRVTNNISKYHARGMTQTMIVVNSDNHAMKTGIIKTTTTKIKLAKISVGVDYFA